MLKFGEQRNGKWHFRFAAHPSFAYWAFNILYRKRILSKGNLYVKRNPGESDFTLEEFNEMANSNFSPLMSKIFYYTKELTGSNSYWNRLRQELRATIEQNGAPTVFFTLSMAEFHWPDLKKVFSLPDDASSEEVKNCICENPHIVDAYFTEKTQAFIKTWLYKYLGASWHWYRFEFAALRGTIHCHGLAKLVNDPNLIDLTKCALKGYLANQYTMKNNDQLKDELRNLLDFDILNGIEAEKIVCEYVDNILTTINPIEPSLWSVPKTHPCKKSFDSLSSDTDYNNDYEEIVNSVQKHSCSSLYCLRQKGNDFVCRFKYPFKVSAKTRLEFTKINTKDGSEKYRADVLTARNDSRINRHQRVQLQGWRANCDISVVIDYHSCLEYLTKYASKPEKLTSVVKDAFAHVSKNISESDFDSVKIIKKLMMRAVGLRDMSIQEVCHQILKQKLFSSSFEVITVSLDGSRKVENIEGELISKMSYLDVYASREDISTKPQIANCNLVQFHSKYYYHDGKLNERKKTVVVRTIPQYSSYSKGLYYGKFCQLQLIKYKIWKDRISSAWDDLDANDENYKRVWQEFLTSDLSRDLVPDHAFELERLQEINVPEQSDIDDEEGSVDREEWMYLSELVGFEDESINLAESVTEDEHHWQENSLDYTFEEIADLTTWLYTEKKNFVECQISIPENESENLAKLNKKQRKAFDLVINHMQTGCSEQLLLLMIGKAGCGKSFLINRLRYALGKKCIISALFGIAAFNIDGKTLHYLLKLPIRGKRNCDLNGIALSQVQENFQGVEYLIIDEFSVISQKTFSWINRRCKQATGCFETPFGGLNVILVGDLGQLPPVNGNLLYDDNPSSEHDCEGFFLYSEFRTIIHLTESERVKGSNPDQQRFKDMLDNIREGKIAESDWKVMLQRTPHRSKDTKAFSSSLRLSFGNKQVADFNYESLKKLNKPIAKIKAFHNHSRAAKLSSDDMEGLVPRLFLSEGCSIMLTRNLWTETGLVNGSLGTVQKIVYQKNHRPPVLPSVVIVQFEKYTGPSCMSSSANCVPIIPCTCTSQALGQEFERTQFPLKLAWAITIHKSQGLTLDSAWVDLGKSERSLGLSYVALSRVRNLEDMIIEPFTFDRLKAITKVKGFEIRKREESRLIDLSKKHFSD